MSSVWTFIKKYNYWECIQEYNGVIYEFHILKSHVYKIDVVYFIPYSKVDLTHFPFKISKELHPVLSIPYYYIHPCSQIEYDDSLANWLRPFLVNPPILEKYT